MGITATGSRLKRIGQKKATGSHYTPPDLAQFVAEQIIKAASLKGVNRSFRILDPAAGEGELLHAFLRTLSPRLLQNATLGGASISDLERSKLGTFPILTASYRNGLPGCQSRGGLHIKALSLQLNEYGCGFPQTLFSQARSLRNGGEAGSRQSCWARRGT